MLAQDWFVFRHFIFLSEQWRSYQTRTVTTCIGIGRRAAAWALNAGRGGRRRRRGQQQSEQQQRLRSRHSVGRCRLAAVEPAHVDDARRDEFARIQSKQRCNVCEKNAQVLFSVSVRLMSRLFFFQVWHAVAAHVTGHRHIDDDDETRAAVGGVVVFARLDQLFAASQRLARQDRDGGHRCGAGRL